ncbi:MAG TPA: alpha/beta fold hydrolase [Gemmatimonadaceae bacterium]|nr:alpha/beta fold hydrolase [Gemmatimonadaceae bacterium]
MLKARYWTPTLSIAALLVVLGMRAPLHAQDPRFAALDSIRAMGLDSVSGIATVYFRPTDRERALALQAMLDEYLRFWHAPLGVETRMRIAALRPEDWQRLTRLPYAFPHNVGPPVNLIAAPATPPPPDGHDTILVGAGRNTRDWLTIGHEGGHLLTWSLMPLAMRDSIGIPPGRMSAGMREQFDRLSAIPQWFWEYAATYFMTAFVSTSRPIESESWRRYLRALTDVSAPRYTHLDAWWGEFMRARASDGTPLFLSPESGGNFGWYQGVVGLLAEHVHARVGTGAAAHIRQVVSGGTSPTSRELVDQLEALAPGVRTLLDSLGAGYREPSGGAAAGIVPRFEPGPCPGEPRPLAEGLKLDCGRLVVWESRDRSSERTVRLPVAILRGPDPSALPPLVLFHGGPGQSGLDSFLPVAAASPLPRMRVVVMFDQRGAGHAEPALCPDFNRRRGEALLAAEAGGTARERERAVVRSCAASLRRQGIDPTAYTTAESASDVVDLRQSLGYATWDVYAGSYGGRLAVAALALDAEGIRSVVLERPMNPLQHRAENPLRLQRALDRLFTACAADVACRTAFPAPSNDLAAVFEELEARPLRVVLPEAAEPRPEIVLDGATLVHALGDGLNAHARIGRIPFLLQELRRGNRSRAARDVAEWAAGRHPALPATISLVPCNDEFGPRALALEDSALAAVSLPVRAIARIRSVRTCADWPDDSGAVTVPVPTGNRAPVLIIAGEYDTSGAPPEDARRIAALLGNTTVVELRGQGHADPIGPCVQRMLLQFWQDPNRAVDRSCIDAMPAIRFATSW